MSEYKKTAKDIAHDKEIAKLKHQITSLKADVEYWKTYANKCNECSSHFEQLYLEALKYLDMTPDEFKKHIKNTEKVADALEFMEVLK